jgi:periplasmic protein TonB
LPSIPLPSGFTPERIREVIGRRAMAVVLVLLVEALLLFLLLALNQSNADDERVVVPMSTFTLDPAGEQTPEPDEISAQETQQAGPPEPAPEPDPIRPDDTPAARVPPPLIPFTRQQAPAPNIPNVPARPAPPAPANGEMMGPPAPRARRGNGDSQRVEGSGPNGEPLYAASWYYEPRPDELDGYLDTAQGPGWALIICQTMPEYRVDNCELITEYPRGSNIGRSLLAATWQFRVRPPRIGGTPQVGAWVRIRFDYDVRRRR